MDFPAISQGLAASAAAVVAPKGSIVGRLTRTVASAFVAAPAPAAPSYVALATGGAGGFPYYWEDPATLLFNADTYRWIVAAVNGGADPAQLSGLFTNRSITTFGSIRFSLSAAQQGQLSAAQAQVTAAQADLLAAWRAVFGQSWVGKPGAPIDVVLQTIATTWANPPGAIHDLLSAPDLIAFLPAAPSQAGSILPVLDAYRMAVATTGQWVNMLSRQTGYLSGALAALRAPTAANGGLSLNDGSIVPAYLFETPVSAILAGLAGGNAGLGATLVAQPAGGGLSNVTLNGGRASVGDPAGILALATSEGAELAGTAIAAATRPVTIAAQFEGVTPVTFQPMPFDPTAMTGWFWQAPILQALQPGTADSGGFGFSPQPPYDFSPQGQFGWLTGLLIARNPALSVTLDQPAAAQIAEAINEDSGAMLAFLGQTLTAPDLTANFLAAVSPAPGDGSAVLRIAPANPPNPGPASRAYVLGGIVRFIGG